MPSLSSKTYTRRQNRKKAMGKVRKRLLRHGSTPAFPIHLDGKPAAVEPVRKPSPPEAEKAD